MRFKQGTHVTDVLFILALFCVFAASSLMVVVIGANVYKNTVTRMNQNFDTRASITYVSNKIRQNDSAQAVSLQEIEGVPALVLEREIEGGAYRTWIYHNDGALREVFTHADNPVKLSDGQSIMKVEQFWFEQLESNLLRITSIDESGRSVSVEILPRC